jgi:S1-C subfamily serine protease
VTGIDGTLITSADDLIVATRQDAVGQHVMLRVVRGGTTMSVPVTLAKNPNG